MTSSSASAYSTVLHPRTVDSHFDMDYYLTTHMPLAAKIWGPYGLQSWQVIQFENPPDGSPSPYAVQAILHWSKMEDLDVVTKDVSKPVFDDVAKFSNRSPIFMAGVDWEVKCGGVSEEESVNSSEYDGGDDGRISGYDLGKGYERS